MSICRPKLASALLAAAHIADRKMIAAFVADVATHPAPNPFPQTSAGAVRQIWRQRAAEFQSFDIQVAGLVCLLAAISDMSVDEVLVQEILRAGAHTANVFHHGGGGRIVGAVLYGKPGCALPALAMLPSLRRASSRHASGAAGQLDLFAGIGS
jgi:hypothetical protein